MDHALRTIVNDLIVFDVTLVQQNLCNRLLHVGSGNIHGFVLRVVRIADAGQHIRNRISDVHCVILLI